MIVRFALRKKKIFSSEEGKKEDEDKVKKSNVLTIDTYLVFTHTKKERERERD